VNVLAFALALAAALSAGQTPTTTPSQAARPVTLVSEVRAAIAAHDLARADALVAERRATQSTTPEVIEAISWLARGAQEGGQPDRAEQYASDAQRLATAAMGTRRVDEDAHLAAALGNAIAVQAQVAAARGGRSDALGFLQKELATYKGTSLQKRIQKDINLLTLEGHPAPALDLSESIGGRLPTFQELNGKVVVLFFWAHWCPDCKIEGPILAKLFARYESQGLAMVAPTQRYGYVARGASASADEELRYIVQVRDQYYPFLAALPVPLSAANHERYGVSSTPTVVILDRHGIVRLYHPGRLTEDELEAALRPLLNAGGLAQGAESELFKAANSRGLSRP
jgi:cytochrome c biogenesis protein CcmG/thiol:disulfide interchange protein DsbE